MTAGDLLQAARPRRILHLEDSPIDAELIAMLLLRAGPVAITRVDSAGEYHEALAQGPYDAILADYSIPGFDGLHALAMAREQAPLTPFIFVSGTLGEEVAVEALRQGATDYVIKQRLARLPAAVERAIAEAKGRAEQVAAQTALRESEARLRFALQAGGLGFWEFDLEACALSAAEGCLAFFALPPGTTLTWPLFLANLHPDDRPGLEAALARARDSGDFAFECRIRRPDGSLRRLDLRGRVAEPAAGPPRRMIGICADITERRQGEERQLLLMREVDHRAKNVLAVVLAALRLTRKDDVASYATAIEGRIGALARAHGLLASDQWAGASLRTLLEGELAPFAGSCATTGEPRTRLQGPPVMLYPDAAQALSMALHELTTNATKHGALSSPQGRVVVDWAADAGADRFRLRWRESGGPPVPGSPVRRGFGSRVLEATVGEQLGGSVDRLWEPSGLVCNIALPLHRWVAPLQGGAG